MAKPLESAKTRDTMPGIYRLIGEFANHVGAQPFMVADRIAALEDLLIPAERLFDALAYRDDLGVPCRVSDYDRFGVPQWLIAMARRAPEFVVDDLATNTIRHASVAVSHDDSIRPDEAIGAWW